MLWDNQTKYNGHASEPRDEENKTEMVWDLNNQRWFDGNTVDGQEW